MRRRALAVAAAALLLFGGLTVVVLNGGMAAFDSAIRARVHGLSAPWLTASAETLTLFGSLGGLGALTAVTLVGLMKKGLRVDAGFLLVVMVGAVLLENAAKNAIQITRPPAFFGEDLTTYSFPSGHALFALCCYGALAVILVRRGASGTVVWAIATCLVAAIGGTRIYLGVHLPSDVLAGYLLATSWLFAVQAAIPLAPACNRCATA